MERRLLPILMTLVLVCALPIWAAFVTSGDVTNPLVCTAGATSPPDTAATRLKSAISNGGDVRLTEDIEISETLVVTRDVTLDLNGHVLKMTGDGSVLKVSDRATLTITDSRSDTSHEDKTLPAGGVITGGKGPYVPGIYYVGGGVFLENDTTLKLEGGTLTGNSGSSIYIGGATLVMSGGTITGETVGVHNNVGTFTMTGGRITGCSDRGVYVYNGNMTMSGTAYIGENPNARREDIYVYESDHKHTDLSVTGKTAKSILISCGARLAVFDIAELREVTAYDELELDTLGDRKTALFLIMSDTDDSFNFLISMCYTQLFNLLCEKADDVYGGRLPVHVRCLIDECANIGQIPKLEKLVATIRSREISACLVLQAQSQLKAIYKDNADTIIGNMDTSIFLGGKEPTTLKELAAVLGKETIDTYNTGESRGRETSHSLNYQKLGKELMSQDELAVMDGGKCILQLRGVRPFLSDKYDITKHPNFQYTADADDKNAFDIEAFLSARLKLKPNEVCDVYEVDTEGA